MSREFTIFAGAANPALAAAIARTRYPPGRLYRRPISRRRSSRAASRTGAPQGGFSAAADFAAGQRSFGRAAGASRCLSPCGGRVHHGHRALFRLRPVGQAARLQGTDHGASRRRSAASRWYCPRVHSGFAHASGRRIFLCPRGQPDGGADDLSGPLQISCRRTWSSYRRTAAASAWPLITRSASALR